MLNKTLTILEMPSQELSVVKLTCMYFKGVMVKMPALNGIQHN